jgi:molybdate transport system ATP-binding protein
VARLATTVIALREGRVAAFGPPTRVLGDEVAVGARGVASVLRARVVAHHDDGLSELATGAGSLHLPGLSAAPGTTIRVRVVANEVLLAREAPTGLSALNILRGTIAEIRPGQGPDALVTLVVGQDRLTARVTRRSVSAIGRRRARGRGTRQQRRGRLGRTVRLAGPPSGPRDGTARHPRCSHQNGISSSMPVLPPE